MSEEVKTEKGTMILGFLDSTFEPFEVRVTFIKREGETKADFEKRGWRSFWDKMFTASLFYKRDQFIEENGLEFLRNESKIPKWTTREDLIDSLCDKFVALRGAAFHYTRKSLEEINAEIEERKK